ncbi:MAG: fimbria/pilus periplasmic chaperone [Candidatus Malihini olakiniferum]
MLSNSEKQPTLVQAWSDESDKSDPMTSLIAVPPVFGMKLGESALIAVAAHLSSGIRL